MIEHATKEESSTSVLTRGEQDVPAVPEGFTLSARASREKIGRRGACADVRDPGWLGYT
jgi:hypothetical protein